MPTTALRAHLINARLDAIKTATPLTQDLAVIAPYRLQVLVLVEQLRTTLQAIERFDREIAELAPRLPDYSLFRDLPGAGPHLAPRLLAAFGEDRDAFSAPMSCRNTPALRRSPSAAARRAGCIGAGSAQLLCAKRLSNGPARPSTNHSGPLPTIANNATRAALIKLRCVPWRSSGFASSIAVGKPHTIR